MTTTSRSITDPGTPPSWPPWHPLSDRGRWAKVAVLAGLLALGFLHMGWLHTGERPAPDTLLADPARHAGEEVELAMMRVVARDGARARLWAPWIEVEADPVDGAAGPGTIISVRGRLRSDGTVAVDSMRVYPRHALKKAIGIVATALAGALALWDLRGVRKRRA